MNLDVEQLNLMPAILPDLPPLKERLEEINLIPAIVEGHKHEFSTDKNVVGASDIPYGMRSIVISKREGLELAWKNTLLSGTLMHYALQKRKVRNAIATLINQALGYTEKRILFRRYILLKNGNWRRFNVKKEKERYIEILPCKYLVDDKGKKVCNIGNESCEGCEDKEAYYFRMHTDIHSTYWDIEIKTTGMPMKMWGDIEAYHIVQLNANMGFNHNPLGFLWKIDRGATKWQGDYESHGGFYNSSSTKFKYLWDHYHMLYPHEFDQALFDYTIEKLKHVFLALRDNTDVKELPCPAFIFECEDECNLTCPNPIKKVKMDDNDTCVHCKEIIEMGTWGIIRNDKMYHYTDEKGHPYEQCVQKCKSEWEVEENE